MRKISLIFFAFLFASCSGFEEYASDTFWPMGGGETPIGSGENFRRVRDGEKFVRTAPLMTQPGNIWPGRVEPVPSIQEVSNLDSHFNNSFRHTLKTLDTDLETVQLKEHESLSIGEEANTEVGVHRKSRAIIPGALPSEVPDPAHRYMEGANRDIIYIPNGDGTTTLVMPNGDVRIVRGDPQAIQKAQRERKISSEGIIVQSQKKTATPVNPTRPVAVLSNKKDVVKNETDRLNEEELSKMQHENGIVDHIEERETLHSIQPSKDVRKHHVRKHHLRKHHGNGRRHRRRHHVAHNLHKKALTQTNLKKSE